MRARICRTLEAVARDPLWEARWLNTLSLMEFVGARKISRTVAAHHPPLAVLEHWADEVRHARAFKALSTALGGSEPGYLCAEAAKAYFAALDAGLAEWAHAGGSGTDEQLSYLLVTCVIERRAMELYPIYRVATLRPEVREELARVIVEEQGHRRSIEERCLRHLGGGGLEEPLALERTLFETFWSAVEGAVLGAGPAAFGLDAVAASRRMARPL